MTPTQLFATVCHESQLASELAALMAKCEAINRNHLDILILRLGTAHAAAINLQKRDAGCDEPKVGD